LLELTADLDLSLSNARSGRRRQKFLVSPHV
jgi:hypothetical protein